LDEHCASHCLGWVYCTANIELRTANIEPSGFEQVLLLLEKKNINAWDNVFDMATEHSTT